MRCLSKDADLRFPDAQSLERALGQCACAGAWDHDRAAEWSAPPPSGRQKGGPAVRNPNQDFPFP